MTNINPPSVFDGDHAKFKTWWSQILNYIGGKRIVDANDRILTALSYMRGGTAELWAQGYIERINSGAIAVADWNAFIAEITEAFQDRNLAHKAREQLEVFTQKKHTIDTYISELELKFGEAGMDDKAEKIRIMEKGVNPQIVDAMYAVEVVPDAYDTFKQGVQTDIRKKQHRGLPISSNSRPKLG
ncbi:hypothetical protein BDN72DRAFT_906728 [Pluteus cervinus]|uniref:Uncharacterized protein n=1 Tax=Pluteus cervinus TaxID=181527 RepID=A0ACD2ZY06_9AGAR|nr:hypothetical protein BDN72DRAFT_906728 [Pluteus cervinus]